MAEFALMLVHSCFLQHEPVFTATMEKYRGALEKLGGVCYFGSTTPGEPPAMPDTTLPLFYLIGTGGTEETVLSLRAARRVLAPDEPVYLIAHPGNNSLPAALEILARVQQDEVEGRIFYLNGPEDAEGLQQIAALLHILKVREMLRSARVGLIGAPSNWLVASMPDAEMLQTTWGPQVVGIPMADVLKLYESTAVESVAGLRDSLVAGATHIGEPLPTELDNVARVYGALKQITTAYHLDALTVRCFDLVLLQQTTGCFALAQLNDEGIIAGCEGDLPSVLGMMWAYYLTGALPWMANPAQLDPARNRLWLAHCTVPRRLVQSYRLRSHFESDLGVGIQGVLPAGPVTLVRIGGKRLERLWVAEGELLRAGFAEDLCRTQAEVALQRGGIVSDLLQAPLGNHLVLVPGRYMDQFREYWELAR